MDPLLCPNSQQEMRIVALINEREVIERILPHLGMWEQCVRVRTARDPSAETFVQPWLACPPEPWRRRDDPFPYYDNEPVMIETHRQGRSVFGTLLISRRRVQSAGRGGVPQPPLVLNSFPSFAILIFTKLLLQSGFNARGPALP